MNSKKLRRWTKWDRKRRNILSCITYKLCTVVSKKWYLSAMKINSAYFKHVNNFFFFKTKSPLQATGNKGILNTLELRRDRLSFSQSKVLRQISFHDLQTIEATESSTTFSFKKILIKISKNRSWMDILLAELLFFIVNVYCMKY